MIKEALQYITDLRSRADMVQVMDINGKTYANKDLYRYDDKTDMAESMHVSTLTAIMDYIGSCSEEFPGNMILHIRDPKTVILKSELNAHRKRETLLIANAVVSEFPFDEWLNQEDFMVNIQASFLDDAYAHHLYGMPAEEKEHPVSDLEAVKRMAGNAEQRNNVQYSDDGVSQVATAMVGAGVKGDVLVPNPVLLRPYRTFQEVPQPESPFVFRISDGDRPKFKLVEAGGQMWRNEAVNNIKAYFVGQLLRFPEDIQGKITVIG